MSMYGDDAEYGATKRKIEHLMERRARLEALLPLAKPRQAKEIESRIEKIDRHLDKSGWTAQQGAVASAAARSGVDGIGGLKFQAQAPPGLGRLVRLPFYPVVGNPGTITAGGFAGNPSSVNPVIIERPVAGATSPGAHPLQTPQISWAILRLVGFETQVKRQQGTSETGGMMLVADLQIGGGANLFTHEDFADSTVYDANQPEFAGLRDYPILKSPNTATVTVMMVGDLDTYRIEFTSSLLAEVLVDDNYGAHIPGPYARRGALVREGGSFV
jgi:hypothetical protein